MIHRQVDLIIDRCKEVTECDNYQVILSGKSNFRTYLAKQAPYKGNRIDSEKPYHHSTVRTYLEDKYAGVLVVVEGHEADDFMALHRFEGITNVCICSRDKDLDTVPGFRYRWACGEKQPEVLPYFVSEWDANRFFFEQMLMGDNTDNIMGCGRKEEVMWGGKPQMRRKGVGPKAAANLIAEANSVEEMHDTVSEQYYKRFPDEDWAEIMLENARLLYMGQTMSSLFEWSWLDVDVVRPRDEENNDD